MKHYKYTKNLSDIGKGGGGEGPLKMKYMFRTADVREFITAPS